MRSLPNSTTDKTSDVILLEQSLEDFLIQAQFADHLNSALAIIDIDSNPLYQNTAFSRLFHLCNSNFDKEQQYKNIFCLDIMKHAIQQCTSSGNIITVEHTYQFDHHIGLDLNIILQPIKEKDAKTVQALLVTIGEENIAFDRFHIERLRQDKKELAERIKVISEDLMYKNRLVHDLLRETPFAIMLIDNDRNIIQMNHACEKLFDTTTRQVMGTKCDQFLHCYKKSNCCPILDEGKQIKLSETATCCDEKSSAILLRSAVVLEHDNEDNMILEAFVDITDRKLAEEELEKHRIKLQSLVDEKTRDLTAVNKELEAFCYSVSHDLRTPVRSINGFSKILIEDFAQQLGNDGIDYLTRVHQASFRMSDLIDDLLSLSRLSRESFETIKVDFDKLCHNVWQQITADHDNNNIEFIVQNNIEVEGDEKMLHILLENLLSNALKFTATTEQPRISIGHKKDNKENIIFIKDNGAGFDMRYASKLFQPFERLHHKTDFEGNGIGLAIVKRIVNRHGGRIWAEGELGKGATFYFTLA